MLDHFLESDVKISVARANSWLVYLSINTGNKRTKKTAWLYLKV